MVVSLSPERTILWDQIRYSGDPKDFVWVLPLPTPDATIEIADSAFFDEMEFQTAPRITPRPGPGPQPCFGCCASADTAAAGGEDDDVIVYDTQVVGPYETVIIGSGDANALQDWLVEHSYRVPEATVPTIDHYVAKNSVFAVLRLAPGEGVQAMQPVRVSFPGYMATFPLKMVTVGATGSLDLSLWVIAEQRYETMNYPTAKVDRKDVVYDWNTSTSNYRDVFLETIDDNGGRAWIVEFARPLSNLWFSSADELTPVYQDIPYPYVTRLRTTMRVENVDQDLMLVPSSGGDVDNAITPGDELNRPFGDQDNGCAASETGRGHVFFLVFITLSLLVIWRRKKRA